LIEKLNLTIQNLETVNEDLTQQYNSEKLTHAKEKEINANLQNRIEEIQKDNKEVRNN